ncbi:TrkH family potassium uptake protein [Thermithiobacillus plumbiphilus]|uniref:Trk system potassium uptake protein n=1 Tax=Thermithiobacillus plumbiphilus TaxID=1729899 RepID=A0ABU9D927_9PROT
MIQIAEVQRVLALLLLIFAQFMLLPEAVAWYYGDGGRHAFLQSYVVSMTFGILLWLPVRAVRRELRNRDGFLIVGLGWLMLSVVSALPFILSGMTGSVTDAMFEAVSGITTTGSTVFAGLDELPHALNFWRHLLHWVGGMGIIVLAVAILPFLGVGGRQIFKAETPGPMKDAALTPRIASTAKRLWLIYVGLTLVCALALWWAGMTPFDAMNHAFSAVSTGGFSTHDASIAYFDSPLIEFVLIVFMLLASINFATHYVALSGRSWRPYWRDPETRATLGVILGAGLLAALYLWSTGEYGDFRTALRYAMFNVVSVASTTGFSNTDFNLWPAFVPVLMLFLSSFAASAGSTGGGIKMVRALLLMRQGMRELRQLIHPGALDLVKFNGRRVDEQVITAIWGFFFLYVATLGFATLALVAAEMDFYSAFSAAIAHINNMGPGLNAVGPATNYGGISAPAKWILIATMLLGRLEIYTLLVLFTRAFWRY